jgi:cell division protein FtsZ
MEALDQIREYLVSHNTEMVFIAAGMGGGTGTGASPVIAKLAHEMDLLTVANVTSPLLWEGPSRSEQARQGIEELRKYVDSLLVIDNESIIEQFGNLPMTKAFGKADDILASATKGIAEIITVESAFIRVDFADLKRVMKGSGRAHMGVASAEGEDRAEEAARKSLCSPLLNSNLISGAKKILLSISAANVDDISYKEAMEVLRYIQSYASYKDEDGVVHQADIIWGASQKPLADGVLEVVVVATGFDQDQQDLTRPQSFAAVMPELEIESEERIPQLQPAQNVERQTAAMPAVLERKISKYDNLEEELRVPSYKRRNMEFVVHNDSSSRRKEIVRDDQPEQSVAASDNKLF